MAIYHKAILLFTTLGLWINISLPAVLANETKILNIAIDQGMSFQAIWAKSETETNAYIEREFARNADIDTLKLTVLGSKIVEIVPLFSLEITRTQWQSSPHIGDWVKYNRTSFALLQPRHNGTSSNEVSVSSRTTSNANDQVFSNTNSSEYLEPIGLNVTEESGKEEKFVNPQFYLGDID